MEQKLSKKNRVGRPNKHKRELLNDSLRERVKAEEKLKIKSYSAKKGLTVREMILKFIDEHP